MSHEINGTNSSTIDVTDLDGDSCRMAISRTNAGDIVLYVESVTTDGCNVQGDDLRALLQLLRDLPPRAPF